MVGYWVSWLGGGGCHGWVMSVAMGVVGPSWVMGVNAGVAETHSWVVESHRCMTGVGVG